jgi:hypothetical protein
MQSHCPHSSFTVQSPSAFTHLQGVIIAVSKKLSHMQEQLNSLALDLGAEYRWTFDQSCTHFIYQGKATDANKVGKRTRPMSRGVWHGVSTVVVRRPQDVLW